MAKTLTLRVRIIRVEGNPEFSVPLVQHLYVQGLSELPSGWDSKSKGDL